MDNRISGQATQVRHSLKLETLKLFQKRYRSAKEEMITTRSRIVMTCATLWFACKRFVEHQSVVLHLGRRINAIP